MQGLFCCVDRRVGRRKRADSVVDTVPFLVDLVDLWVIFGCVDGRGTTTTVVFSIGGETKRDDKETISFLLRP